MSTRSAAEGISVHPYVIKLDIKMQQLDRLVNKIYEIADCNMILTNESTGECKFELNSHFADKLDSVSTIVVGLGKQIAEKATSVREKIESVIDQKRDMQEIQFIGVLEPTVKKIKTEVLSDSDGENNSPDKENRDGHFRYAKSNENDGEIHSFHCKYCPGVFRDTNEFRNHQAQHSQEFFKCLMCDKIFRTVMSFENHQKSHSTSYTCSICGQFFQLKTSLKNHSQVHLNLKLKCSHQNCSRTFRQHSNQLHHIQWGHKTTRDVQCTLYYTVLQTWNYS